MNQQSLKKRKPSCEAELNHLSDGTVRRLEVENLGAYVNTQGRSVNRNLQLVMKICIYTSRAERAALTL